MIYLIVTEKENVCKIGYSNNPEKRLQSLQTANAERLILSKVITGDKKKEKELHLLFKNYKLEGEWFSLTSEIVDYFNHVSETFSSYRTSEGVSWVDNFTSLMELKTFMYMIEFQKIDSGIITFTKLQIKECALFFKCTEKTIRNTIANLIKNDFLIRIELNNYYSNPLTFYKGGSIVLKERLIIWNKLKTNDNKI
jgi:hypothetical protein